MKKRLIASFVAGLMLMQTVTVLADFDNSIYADAENHWAKDTIETWSEKEIIQGYNGNFYPDNNITRGEMAVILERIMGYQIEADNSFDDLDDDFYTEALLKANQAEIINGYEENIRPNDSMTREEAAVVIARVLNLDTTSEDETDFVDNSLISDWAIGAVATLTSQGVINGRGDDTFAPQESITRAEIITIIDRAIALLADEETTYSEDVDGTVVINQAGVSLADMSISGDLIIAEGVADGEVYLDDVVIEGNVYVKGGGEDSVYFNNVTVNGAVVVNKDGDSVRIVASGSTTIELIEVYGDIIIVATDLDGGYIGTVAICGENVTSINLSGTFDELINNVSDVVITSTATIASTVMNAGATVNGEYVEAETSSSSSSSTSGSSGGTSSGGTSSGGGTTVTSTYSISVDTSIVGGVITADKTEASEGDTVTLTATANADYIFGAYNVYTVDVYNVAVDTVVVTADTFVMPAADVVVSGSFVSTLGDYTISVDTVVYGTITADKVTADEGDAVTLTATATAGYKLEAYAVYYLNQYNIGQDVEVLNNVFTMPAGDVTVSASFIQCDYVVSINSIDTENGTVTTDLPYADEGDTVTLTATADSRYVLESYLVTDAEGNEVTVTSNTFVMPASDVTISAIFVNAPYEYVEVNSEFIDERFADTYPKVALRDDDGYYYGTSVTIQLDTVGADGTEVYIISDGGVYANESVPSVQNVIYGLTTDCYISSSSADIAWINITDTNAVTIELDHSIYTYSEEYSTRVYFVLVDETGTSTDVTYVELSNNGTATEYVTTPDYDRAYCDDDEIILFTDYEIDTTQPISTTDFASNTIEITSAEYITEGYLAGSIKLTYTGPLYNNSSYYDEEGQYNYISYEDRTYIDYVGTSIKDTSDTAAEGFRLEYYYLDDDPYISVEIEEGTYIWFNSNYIDISPDESNLVFTYDGNEYALTPYRIDSDDAYAYGWLNDISPVIDYANFDETLASINTGEVYDVLGNLLVDVENFYAYFYVSGLSESELNFDIVSATVTRDTTSLYEDGYIELEVTIDNYDGDTFRWYSQELLGYWFTITDNNTGNEYFARGIVEDYSVHGYGEENYTMLFTMENFNFDINTFDFSDATLTYVQDEEMAEEYGMGFIDQEGYRIEDVTFETVISE